MLLTDPEGLTARRLQDALGEVERRFRAELGSDLDCVEDLITHVERYRGKMLRPTLVVVSAMALEDGADAADPDRPVDDDALTLAAVCEMVHMATLVHDDVLDEADVRRRGSTINALFGNEAAVMLGDYLISHAYHLCSSLDLPRVSRVIADATNTVCEGELLQLANRNNWALSEKTYFEVIRRKTAALVGVCCRLPVIVARERRPDARRNGRPDETEAALQAYGEKIGIAFQIIDDLLDLTGDFAAVGKTLGKDLEKGKLTLPIIRHLDDGDEAADQTLAMLEAMRAPGRREERENLAVQVRDRVVASGAVDSARETAGELIAAAKASLVDHLPASAAREVLVDMADAVLDRDR